ncbi:hypothetical protein GCM10011400_72590 [Paraburkholderia caffeinilytica]|uniref:Uncharacterized protein n=1 Tax=Paraburkholderia caffeinilytica TaxID=1761016 RepID=A0ABQ1NGS3_9BURK|nr:hypothetical protein GCM10011400_72590 [Paraburkholderia caffeinilytica]CAB3809431.1 hypothetical protein LMG28690_07291 [Paraburkholderia caffeinilytica]
MAITDRLNDAFAIAAEWLRDADGLLVTARAGKDDRLACLIEAKPTCVCRHILVFGDRERSTVFAKKLIFGENHSSGECINLRFERCR